MMNKDTQFQSENFCMSILGHLVLIAIMTFSFSVVIERAKLVTPNRVEIIELDLKNIVLTFFRYQLTKVPIFLMIELGYMTITEI